MRRIISATSILLRTLTVFGVGVLSGGARAEQLPVPPLPPAHPLFAEIAPVPNVDARAPVVAESYAPSVDLRLYRARAYDPSMGFAPGSRYQNSEDRKPIQTPGLSISVPLK